MFQLDGTADLEVDTDAARVTECLRAEVIPGGRGPGQGRHFVAVRWLRRRGRLSAFVLPECFPPSASAFAEFLEAGGGDCEAVAGDAECADVEVGAEAGEFGGAFDLAEVFDAALEGGSFVDPSFCGCPVADVAAVDAVLLGEFSEGGPAGLAFGVGEPFDVVGFEALPVDPPAALWCGEDRFGVHAGAGAGCAVGHGSRLSA